MSLFPNIVSNPALRARQDQLDAQWSSLNGIQQNCSDLPSQAWVQFVNDLRNWREFYDSGSDWSQSSEQATNDWQIKAQEWTTRMAASGCGGTAGSVGDTYIPAAGGIPTIKDPPPLSQGLLDEASDAFKKGTDALESPFKTLGWVAVGIVVLIIVAVIWISTRGHASGYGVDVGRSNA
jgi:hypothetical protein